METIAVELLNETPEAVLLLGMVCGGGLCGLILQGEMHLSGGETPGRGSWAAKCRFRSR